ncbi:hypothetical protein [Acanthopleuribacter pedis]|uniref:Uncharacterized protein n=1 Tax=Acanthopleuribacter pedis TaxID=442870 RepID=A0A8J7Q0T2_9BACT|nr:hypothetical protein [Acanthopleuribacter pedis]MBO1318307.1 hypothetical protein [Acanthopleuribacter pedis]
MRKKVCCVATTEATAQNLILARSSCKNSTDLVDFSKFVSQFYGFLMQSVRRLRGTVIAKRIEIFLKEHTQYRRGELGQRLGSKKDTINPASHIKRCNDFLKKLRRGDLFNDLNAVAKYLDVSVEYLLFGEMPKLLNGK